MCKCKKFFLGLLCTELWVLVGAITSQFRSDVVLLQLDSRCNMHGCKNHK
ncbi:hypothetical protein EXN66_Car010322 [Channa argus]|uniref:Uncharacterized protein n=1 Tax=Channa argus TaxID=215402 RepID=A0A6G1PXE7_CHAAH|nr:hypothetical protein EXN66_Car010322 [Channa argus]